MPDVYAIVPDVTSLPIAMKTLQDLRHAGVKVQMHASPSGDGMGSMKSQFKKADGSGAKYALIFGADELAQGQVAVKPLRGDASQSAQQLFSLVQLHAWVAQLQA